MRLILPELSTRPKRKVQGWRAARNDLNLILPPYDQHLILNSKYFEEDLNQGKQEIHKCLRPEEFFEIKLVRERQLVELMQVYDFQPGRFKEFLHFPGGEDLLVTK